MNEDPRRLVDDPAISKSLRDDLAHAGEEHHAYAAAYDASSKVAGLQAALTSQGSAAASSSMGLLSKAALGVVVATAFMVAGAVLHARLWARGDSASPDALTLPASGVKSPAIPQVLASPAIAPEAPAAAPLAAPLAASNTLARRAPNDGTQQEIRQLARIRASLKSGDAMRALELAERGQRQLGEGALWQEREALAVLALLRLDRTEQAAQRSAVLFARFPSSPFRAEIERGLREAHEH
jgi:hypothetical protein